jgi:hypothetical protein
MVLFCMALVVAILACSGLYQTVMAPAIQAAIDPTALALLTAQPKSGDSADIPTQQVDIITVPVTPTPLRIPQLTTPMPTQEGTNIPIFYYAQSGDTLPAVAAHFGVKPSEITSPSLDPLPDTGLITPNQLLMIPRRLQNTSAPTKIMPDSEVVYSPSAVDFDVKSFTTQGNGYLNQYAEYLGSTGMTSGADLIQRVATDYSINPRLLIILVEYQSHWVFGQPPSLKQTDYPLGLVDLSQKGLYHQLTWAASQLSIGYYGWREGTLSELTFPDGSKLRLAPELNAGSVALLYLFAQIDNIPQWAGALYSSPDSLSALNEKVFGNPWLRAQSVEPLFPATLTQPNLTLSFAPGLIWSLTGGPHAAWGAAGSLAALDFAPGSTEHGCVKSDAWVLAAATGQVLRSDRAVVIIDLDGDGHEATGWTLMYLHIATEGRIAAGTWVAVGDKIGHPSCEGGVADGTHFHIARKYNGEWIEADGPLPFNLDGWIAHFGDQPYLGSLTRGDKVVTASRTAAPYSYISRDTNSSQ